MATLVLTTIGSLVGGPVGGAIGALLGQQVDQQIFAPKGRQGPRLGDLAVQTSTYGQPLPKIYGRMRAAGSVIWATDLREEASTSGGGKGRPEITSYSYSVSFAVALSARPILTVGRIWADGKLLRGAAGDWKSETGFRLYLGGEDQAVDPLIAAAEGLASTPAYRGIAYAVFEDFQLADYGNRIPSLTFELTADEGAVAAGAVAAGIGAAALLSDGGPALIGYAAAGDSMRAAIEPLAAAAGLTLRDEGERLALRRRSAVDVVLPTAELGAAAKAEGRGEIERQASGTLPDEWLIAHYDPARDFQSSVQRARRNGPARRAERTELPAALEASGAKAIVEDALALRWTERARATVRVPWRRLGCRPGSIVRIGSDPGRWRVVRASVERMATELVLVAAEDAAAATGSGAGGRASLAPDLIHGPTMLMLLDLPPLNDVVDDMPRLWVAAAGASSGWRRAALMTSLDAGASWQAAGGTAAASVMGHAATPLPQGDAALFDRRSAVEIQLLHDAMLLQSCTDDALVQGTNAAMLGDELLQFGDAQPLGGGRWRLSRLVRGRRGTEEAMAGHAAGDPFVLLDARTLLPLVLPQSALERPVAVMGVGIGDGGAPVIVERIVTGAALRPPPPVHLRAARIADGTIRLRWVRRSRAGWAWLSGQATPLAEEGERYRLRIVPSVGAPRELETATAAYDYSPAAQAEDGATGATGLTVIAWQLGSVAPSRAATASFIL